MPNGPADHDDASPGPLLAIGGAEDKLGKRTVLSEFVRLAGGEEARIAVIPTASSLGPEIIEVYDALFRRLGAREVVAARPESREEADDPAFAGLLDKVTGIFMTGGNQLKLSAVVNGTAFGEAIREAHLRGVTVGGTSAGASIQSSHMVAFGSGGSTPKQRMTQLAAGLGLLDGCVIDQHFGQRKRHDQRAVELGFLGEVRLEMHRRRTVRPDPDGVRSFPFLLAHIKVFVARRAAPVDPPGRFAGDEAAVLPEVLARAGAAAAVQPVDDRGRDAARLEDEPGNSGGQRTRLAGCPAGRRQFLLAGPGPFRHRTTRRAP